MSENSKLSQTQGLTVNLELIMGGNLDQELREELTACQHFLIVLEFVRGKQHVFKFASTNNTPIFLAKVNLAFKFAFFQRRGRKLSLSFCA